MPSSRRPDTGASSHAAADYTDFAHTGPGTLAGRYMRRFWQPVYRAQDLPAGHAKPIRIMSEDFTLYRGESGRPQVLAFRCAHRGTQLSTGWVEGDCIRCFYHGWKYDPTGQCVEQPAEDPGFAPKVKIKSYPCKEYLGLIFGYFGDGAPPPFPRYPDFDQFEGLLDTTVNTFVRRCNYFQEIENAVDTTHVGFVHRVHGHAFEGLLDSPTVWAHESPWGMTYYAKRRSGLLRVNQIGMPNILHLYALSPYPNVGATDCLFWFVPIDDETHTQLSVTLVPLSGEAADRYSTHQVMSSASMDTSHIELAERILAGELRLQDVDPTRPDIIELQDDVAQVGQGRIADRNSERLGRGDRGILLLRKIWLRELKALGECQALTQWSRPGDLRAHGWQTPA